MASSWTATEVDVFRKLNRGLYCQEQQKKSTLLYTYGHHHVTFHEAVIVIQDKYQRKKFVNVSETVFNMQPIVAE
jgi:hypothetical protein